MTRVLTIGQLASFVGVTPRAIRHYHHLGLLPEAERTASGYRLYDGQAVIDLLRIRTLADAGVPLARVRGLLDADPAEFDRALRVLDRELKQRIAHLQASRRRIAGLAAGEHLVLPQEVIRYLDRVRALGISESTVVAERDGWILLHAAAPDQVATLVEAKAAALDDARFVEIYRGFDQASGWSVDDPRLVELADAIIAYALDRLGDSELAGPGTTGHTTTEALLASLATSRRPAWDRLDELCRERMPR